MKKLSLVIVATSSASNTGWHRAHVACMTKHLAAYNGYVTWRMRSVMSASGAAAASPSELDTRCTLRARLRLGKARQRKSPHRHGWRLKNPMPRIESGSGAGENNQNPQIPGPRGMMICGKDWAEDQGNGLKLSTDGTYQNDDLQRRTRPLRVFYLLSTHCPFAASLLFPSLLRDIRACCPKWDVRVSCVEYCRLEPRAAWGPQILGSCKSRQVCRFPRDDGRMAAEKSHARAVPRS